MRTPLIAFATLLVALMASEAKAVCIYNGKLYAKTTVAQEFRDSRWVVRAKVLKAHDHYSDNGDSFTTYDLLVEQSFKGALPRHVRFFTMRDSGGFYLDNGSSHDIGGEYLLFLNSNRRQMIDPTAIQGTVSVNYSCGQSKAWHEVGQPEIRELAGLSKH